MVDKISQVTSNIPAANADTNKQYLVISGYPVVFSFSNEPNPEASERIRDILLATSYAKKYVHEGYGPQHIATYLNDNGYRARSGKCWHPASIRGMVRNLTYTGVLRCGDAHSELLQELQVITEQQFEAAQRIRENRSNRAAQESEYRVPLAAHALAPPAERNPRCCCAVCKSKSTTHFCVVLLSWWRLPGY